MAENLDGLTADRVEEVVPRRRVRQGAGAGVSSPAACSRCASKADAEQLYLATLNAHPARHRARTATTFPEIVAHIDARAGGPLLLQLLGLPVAARQLGDRPALPDHADPPAERAADPARHAAGRHLRLRRRDRPLRRRPEGQALARAAPGRARASRTSSASSSPAPTRRSWATCTTCSATPTPCTSGSPSRATRSPTWSTATR